VTTSHIIPKGTIVGVYLGVITTGGYNATDDNTAYENGDTSIYGDRLTHAIEPHTVINHDC